ncbi:MAG: hypothetical protein OXG40_09985 [Acidimicrobiaceae bacterium]|nr:hypothetical protein [Acidimicrobiaceae bacterium]MDE0516214.1 hypothetical protein [Acidimicrobiaceae bacterium]
MRQLWPNEATDFTPWPADNIDLLGDALDMTLEEPKTETSAGRRLTWWERIGQLAKDRSRSGNTIREFSEQRLEALTEAYEQAVRTG